MSADDVRLWRVQAAWRRSREVAVRSCGRTPPAVYRAPNSRPTRSSNSAITCATRTIATVRARCITYWTCCGAGASSCRGGRWWRRGMTSLHRARRARACCCCKHRVRNSNSPPWSLPSRGTQRFTKLSSICCGLQNEAAYFWRWLC